MFRSRADVDILALGLSQQTIGGRANHQLSAAFLRIIGAARRLFNVGAMAKCRIGRPRLRQRSRDVADKWLAQRMFRRPTMGPT